MSDIRWDLDQSRAKATLISDKALQPGLAGTAAEKSYPLEPARGNVTLGDPYQTNGASNVSLPSQPISRATPPQQYPTPDHQNALAGQFAGAQIGDRQATSAQGANAGQQAAASGLSNNGTAGRSKIDDKEWLSNMLALLWPYASNAGEKQAMAMLPDLLNQSKPSWMTELRITELELGSVPPRIINLVSREGDNKGCGDLFLEFELDWQSNLHVAMEINPAPKFITKIPGMTKMLGFTVTLKNLKVNGRLRMSMIPLMDEIPVVGAMQGGFLDIPEYDYDLELGVVGKGLTHMLEPWMDNFLNDYVLSSYVLPQHFFYNLAPNVGDIKTPAGFLEVRVLEGHNVPKMDYFTQSSPYCQLWLTGANKLTKKTEVAEAGRNPVWKKGEFAFPVHMPETQRLVVTLWDSDVGADDEIGRSEVKITQLATDRTQDVTVHFKDPNASQDDESGQKDKPSKRSRFLSVIVGAKTEQAKGLEQCTVHMQLTYHALSTRDLEALNKQQMAGQRPTSDKISDPRLRSLADKYGLLDDGLGEQARGAAMSPDSKPATYPTTAAQDQQARQY